LQWLRTRLRGDTVGLRVLASALTKIDPRLLSKTDPGILI
jgi:hypothetical protein